MRRFSLWVFVLLLAAVLVPGTVAQQEQPVTPENLENPLVVVDSVPYAGEELALEGPVTVYFDRPVDCATAQAAVSVVPDTPGSITCDEASASLSFTPDAPFVRGERYTLRISDDLRAQDGGILAEPFELPLSTVGFLGISEVLPTDSSVEVSTDAMITVIFNRPVVPLVIAEDMGDLPQPLTFSPPVAGTGEWLNTAIYIFRPEVALAGGTEYTVTIAAGLTAVDGSVLEQPFSWRFRTVSPQVLDIYPAADSSGMALETAVEVIFNMPMDRASVEANFFLSGAGAVGSVRGTFEWNDDGAGFRFVPDDLLALDTVYTYGFTDAERVLEQTGSAGLAAAERYEFATVPPPSIVATNPPDGAEGVYPYDGFTIGFASPMDADTLPDKISIEPPPSDIGYFYRGWNNNYVLSFRADPNTTYTVTIAPGMADVYGNTIDTELVVTYTTGGFGSDIYLQVPGSVGFYNAYRDTTSVFATHRNISQLDLSLWRVDTRDFALALSGENYWNPTVGFAPRPDSLISAWQMPAAAPDNEWQYELLDLGLASADICAGAPPTRLAVGETAVVVTDADLPLVARSEPVTGERLELMYNGYSLPIVGGPVCAESGVWWQVRLRDGTTGWAVEGVFDANGEPDYFLEPRFASAEVTPVVIPESTALEPGVYFFSMQSPETAEAGREPINHFMVVSTASLVLKTEIDAAVVWVTDVQTGQPIAGAPVTIYDSGYTAIGSGSTGADGIARIEIPRQDNLFLPLVAVYAAEGQFGMGYTNWTEGIDPWRFEQNYDFYPLRYTAYLYTDRPVYRPGQTVYFRGVVRSRDDVTYTPPDFESVPIAIYNDRGEAIYQATVALTAYGTFSGQFDIAEDGGLGYYRLEVTMPVPAMTRPESASLNFTVAEYRVPEFQVSATPQVDAVAQGDTIRVQVDSRYFFGGAVSNASVEYNVLSTPYFFNYTGEGYYSFTDVDYTGDTRFYGYYGQLISSGTGMTDADGMLLIEVPASLEDSTQSVTYTIEATVRDESNQTVSGRADVVVHQGLVYVGVRPESYVGASGEANAFEFISVDWDSSPIANQELNIEVSELRWSSVQERDAYGNTSWTWEVEVIPVTTGAATTDAGGQARFEFTPPNGGIFQVRASTRDEAGNTVRSSALLWVSSSSYVSWRQDNSNRIDLIANQEDYSVGDTAEILITSPFQGEATALITVERGAVLFTDVVTLTSNSYVYELPITDAFAPNVYVSVMIVKGVDEFNPVAAFRMGLIQLLVDNERKELTIAITADTAVAGPGDTVNYTVRTTDYTGAPVQAEVGVALTDLATLSLMEPNSGPILDAFYNPQALGIRTSTPLTINTDLLTQTTLDTIKGGGGGGGGDIGTFEVREEFVDTPYFNGAMVTDENGEATFSVTLPDNLTTWRLDARAVTSGADGLTLVGQETFDLLSTRPLIVRPVTPRFFIIGDEAVLGAVVNNNSGADLDVVVTLQATGVTLLDGGLEQTLSIPAGQRGRVNWRVRVEDVENVELIFFADGNEGAFTDAARPAVGQGDNRLLPVYRYEAPEVVGTAGVLREGGERVEVVALPRRFDVTQGELTVNIQPSLAATTLDGLDYLENYPHQCTEQTVSRFLPNIMTYRALDDLGVADATLRDNLTREVNTGVQILIARQRADGGWGWFPLDESNPLTTAYALIGLVEARAQGFAVPDDVITRAQDYLQTQFITPRAGVPQWQMNRQAFLLYALARSGDPDIARTTTLWDRREQLSQYAQAFLAMTLHLINPDDSARIDPLLDALASNAVVSATGMHWEEPQRDYWNWNTDTRTTAIVLMAFTQIRPTSDLLPNAVRWLLVARTADAWETTQETAWAVMALTDWMLVTGELRPDYTYTAALNGAALAEGTASPANVTETQRLVVDVGDLLTGEANRLVFERSDGDGSLYYTAHLRVYLPVPEIEPLDRGIVLERRYTLFGDESQTPITQARIGDVVQVRLTIILPNDLHYAVIEDPIPAGAEAINPQLATSQQVGTQPELNRDNPFGYGWGWWWFSETEFRDEKVVLYATYLPAGTYEYVYTLRMGVEGTYNVIPATGQEFYFPEVYGRSAGTVFTVLPEAGE